MLPFLFLALFLVQFHWLLFINFLCGIQEVIDDVNERLVKLHEEFGSKFCDIVTNALKEIMTYNPSEKYIVEVPWNYITNKELP
jgi:hypothetical protein